MSIEAQHQSLTHLERACLNNPKSRNLDCAKILKVSSLITGIGLFIALPFATPLTDTRTIISITASGLFLAFSSWYLFVLEPTTSHPAVSSTENRSNLPNPSATTNIPSNNLKTVSITKGSPSRLLRALDDSSCKGAIVGVYVTTNEDNLDAIRGILSQIPAVPESCHIGFSGWHNFDLIAMRKSTYGLICDFNPNNKKFIEKTLELAKESNNRHVFANKMARLVKKMDDLTRPIYIQFSPKVSQSEYLTTEEEVGNELTRPGSWLADDQSFEYVKNLAERDRIAAITVDIRDTARFQRIAEIYHNNNIAIDSLYLSNICHYMEKPEDRKAYASTVHTLINDETILIHCPKEKVRRGLPQMFSLGSEFKTSEADNSLFEIHDKR